MYGGTFINIGCIPSKTLVHDGIEGASFGEAFSRKNEVVSALNNKNYNNLASIENIDILDYKAKFISNNEIALLDEAGNVKIDSLETKLSLILAHKQIFQILKV